MEKGTENPQSSSGIPGTSYIVYMSMESLLDKLKILSYEQEFLSTVKLKPIHRYYFVAVRNTGEQFFLFTSLASWLILKAGRFIERPQEYDDPNNTIANILDVLRETGVTVDFPPNKLRQGAGEHVVYVLNHFADEALKFNNFTWKEPEIVDENDEEVDAVEDESEVILDRVEEEMMAAYSDDSDDENIFRISEAKVSEAKLDQRNYELATNTDTEAWREELERVLPQLKVVIRNDNRDWRAHFEQIKLHRSNIDQSLILTSTNLNKLQNEISNTLDKISNRERFLNKELQSIMEEYRLLQDQVLKSREDYRNINGGVMERTRQLSALADKMEMIKQQMEEQGSSMTDGTPLVNIKKAVTKVSAEITEMDVRIGVLSCLLLQAKIRDKNMLEQDLYHSSNIY